MIDDIDEIMMLLNSMPAGINKENPAEETSFEMMKMPLEKFAQSSEEKNDKKQRMDKIKVCVRCRPMNEKETTEKARRCVDVSEKTGEVRINKKSYFFDKVFGPDSSQVAVYKEVVVPIVKEVLGGYSCTIFAYGQTGSGKTYTMEGEKRSGSEFSWENDPHSGIIPRTMNHIFDKLNSGDFSEYAVHVSLIEIYNDEIFDLLSDRQDIEKLKMFDDPNKKGAVKIKGVKEFAVSNKEDIYAIMERGSQKRKVTKTKMNAHSSRSHCVFQIQLSTKVKVEDSDGIDEDYIRQGKLYLVDLAGSENVGRSVAQNQQAREAGHINQSLLALGRVVTGLVEGSPHIPYRESKLTRLLQDSLGGSTKTCIISTISPASTSQEETLSTLDYSARAKKISNKPQINQVIKKRALIEKFVNQIKALKADLAASQQKNSDYIDPTEYEKMKEELEALNLEKEQMLVKDAQIEEEMQKLRNEIDDLIQKNKELKRKYKSVKADLHKTDFLKGEQLKANLKQYHLTKDLCTDLDKNEGDIVELQRALGSCKQVMEKNASSIARFREDEIPECIKRSDFVQKSTDATESHMEKVKASVGRVEATLKEELDSHASVSRKGFEDLTAGVNELLASFKSKTEECAGEVESTSERLLKKLFESLEDFKISHDKSIQKLQTITNSVSSSVESLNSEVLESLSSIQPEMENATSASEESTKILRETEKKMKETIEATMSQMMSQMISQMSQCLSSKSSADEKLRNAANSVSKSVESAKATLESKTGDIKNSLAESKKTLVDVNRQTSAHVETSIDKKQAYSESLKVALDKITQDASCHEKTLYWRVKTATETCTSELEKREQGQKKKLSEIKDEVGKLLSEGKSFATAQKSLLEEIDASNKSTEGALTSLSLVEYNESGETPAKRDRRSLQKPLSIRNEVQILREYEEPSTTIDEEDLPQDESLPTEPEEELDSKNISEDSMAFECRQATSSAPMFGESKKTRSKKRKGPNSPLVEPAGKRASDEHIQAKKFGPS
ncbi:Oidioi.mRNA.OKI2018_I69.XSR.g16744.t1.cds [Oikopleura dioica]|uniref:Oidioi.mRNA.OKI2018_I69.XSR.g16744.t1.cds n=1 Tax=Oikopleura dioica TaxID=34765 RepID=A0ABN7SM86_OIKDI|nr:Oidioi.mRNA.OKI2018_I69.XSR.g16744.t1.cds [Oikopleura dioica]